MTYWSPRRSRVHRRFLTPVWGGAVTVATVVALLLGMCAQVAFASPAGAAGVPAVTMHGYAKGPAQQTGSAAGRAHYVPASATRASATLATGTKGHAAPVPDLAPPAMGTRVRVSVGAVTRAAGAMVADHHLVGARSPGRATTTASLVEMEGTSGTDNASYSVATSYDTVPMADQTGRIAVTLTNTGTSTWGSGYALGTLVFASGDTTGTGTPVTTGVTVPVSGTVAPGGTTTIESVTPNENPGSYEICWDMVNAAGTFFSAEGGDEYCAPYTIEQYAPEINEQEPLAGTDADTQTPSLSASAVIPGGYPANPSFTYAFEIISGPTLSSATVDQSSGWVTGNSNTWSPSTALTWGDTYYWVATVTDVASPSSSD
jgi:hypothetical protein